MEAQDVPARLIRGISRVIRGKQAFLELLTAAFLAKGHALIDDVPGLGKTTLAKTLARLVGSPGGETLVFKRIQGTPDLLPYDISGVDVYNPETRSFAFIPGPVFANLVLADEINRTTPKVQSALLEVMAEGQVTVGSSTRPVPTPFMVLATQNPVESEGTFPLPAAQLDRFMVRLSLGYPDRETELSILDDDPSAKVLSKLQAEVSIQELLNAQTQAAEVFCHPSLKEAIADLVRKTRDHKAVHLGASPRAALHLLAAARALAFVRGRGYAVDQDVLDLAAPAIAHRIRLRDPRAKPEALMREIAFETIQRAKGS